MEKSLWDEVESSTKEGDLSKGTLNHQVADEGQSGFLTDVSQVFELFAKISNTVERNSGNRYLTNPVLGMKLVSQLLEASSKNEKIEKLYQEFVDYMDELFEMLNNVAAKNLFEMLAKVLDIDKELSEVIKFSELVGKSVVGIGGSFSSGKSSFLNSILNTQEDILPIDTRPTTSVPTYIVQSDENMIFAFNRYGNKLQIDKERFQAISHAFSDVYKIRLSSIIKSIVIYSKDMPYKNIAFLDVPGYSKADGTNQIDKSLAKGYLKNLNALIWLIDSDNGTIRKSDIDFLNELELKDGVRVLFIINKADKKPLSELQKILDSTRENLANSFRQPFDITVYSSHDREEYFNQNIIQKFLSSNNIAIKNDLYERLENIFYEHKRYLEEENEKSKRLLGVFNRLDTIAYNVVSKIEGYEYLEKAIKEGLSQNKKEIEIYEEVRKKGLSLLSRILNEL